MAYSLFARINNKDSNETKQATNAPANIEIADIFNIPKRGKTCSSKPKYLLTKYKEVI